MSEHGPRVTVNFLRFPFSKSCPTQLHDRCVMFADKSSGGLPMLTPLFALDLLLSFTIERPSPLPALSSLLFRPLPSTYRYSSLNNKYERVLREYPEGAISGVQASDHPLGTLLRNRPPAYHPPPPPSLRLLSLTASSTTRNASLIHLERGETRHLARLWV